jgi:uncharacterized protein (TIGR02300 family)
MPVAKPELGNKRNCQNCGTRFFDLNKVPITCPKCGTIFQAAQLSRAAQRASLANDDDEEVETPVGAELVSLEDADAGDDKIVVVAEDDVEIEGGDETFLEEEEEDNDDVADLIDGDLEDDEER